MDITLENIEKLEKSVDSLSKIQQSMALFPMIVRMEHLCSKMRKNDSLKIRYIKCVIKYLQNYNLNEIDQIKTIAMISMKDIFNFENLSLKEYLSEELIDVHLQLLTTCLKKCNISILERLYTEANIVLCNMCLISTKVMDQNVSKNLKVSSIECLSTIFYVHSNADKNDAALRCSVANSVYLFLPKVVKTLVNVSIDNNSHYEILKLKALESLTDILCIIFEFSSDESVQKKITNSQFEIENLKSNAEHRSLNYNILDLKTRKDCNKRSKDWLIAASSKLRHVFTKLLSLLSSQSSRIRYFICVMCHDLLENCSMNIDSIVDLLFEGLIVSVADENEEIKNVSLNFMLNITNWASLSKIDYGTINEKLFRKHVNCLEGALRRQLYSEQLYEFNFFYGFFTIQINGKNRCQQIFVFPGIIKIFCKSFLLSLEFNINSQSYLFDNCKTYKFSANKSIYRLVHKIIILLGQSQSFEILYEFILKQMSRYDKSYETEYIVFATYLISECQKPAYFYKKLLDVLLSENNWNLSYNIESNKQSSSNQLSLYEVQCNILHTFVIIESIGAIAVVMKHDFELYLFKILPKVLQFCCSEHTILKKTSLETLKIIQESLSFNSINTFLLHYSDFLNFNLNIMLRRKTNVSNALMIASYILQFQNLSEKIELDKLMDTLLTECTNTSHLSEFLEVYKVFLNTACKQKSGKTAYNENLSEINLIEFYMKSVEIAKSEVDDFDNSSKCVEEAMDECDKIPANIILIKTMIQSIIPHITSRYEHIQIKSIECIIIGLPILRKYESEVLPLIHVLWNKLIEVFCTKHLMVFNKCFSLFVQMTNTAKDFIKKRSLELFIPYINTFLEESFYTERSHQKTNVILNIINNYAVIIINLNIGNSTCYKILEMILKYMDIDIFIKSCMIFFKLMMEFDAPLVFSILYPTHRKEFENILKLHTNN